MSSIGVYSNPDQCGTRRDDDFYPTPPEATEAFCRAELFAFRKFVVWEPACGDGAISEVLKRYGCTVVSTDLVDRGYGVFPLDFLAYNAFGDPLLSTQAPAIITNPPFVLAEEFIRRAHDHDASYVAMLLKANFLRAGKRLRLFDDRPPARIYPLSWRPDFTGAGAPHTDCAWFVWDKSWPIRHTRYMRPLERPDPLGLVGQDVFHTDMLGGKTA